MSQAQANTYLRNRVLSADPLELRLMLFDGAVKFCRQAADAIGKSDWEGMYNGLIRAQKIVMELNTSLKHDVSPDLCARLAALYTYIYRRLVDANLERDDAPIHEAINLLEYERETWRLLIDKAGEAERRDLPAHPTAHAGQPIPDAPLGRIGPPADAPRQHLSVEG